MPSFSTRDGCRLEYALRGDGPLVALTPGGREAGAAVDGLAAALAPHARVLTWDHPPAVSQAMARLIPGATLAPSAWPGAAWMDRFTGRTPGSVFDLYPLLAPAMVDFLARRVD